MKNKFEIEIEGSNGNEIIQEFINQIHEDTKEWKCKGINLPWFRGQSDSKKPPLPVVFRKKHKGKEGYFDEFWLSTTFRNRAPNFGETPESRNDIDKWLFLMRHMELPTRLLDWSESALISLFMATNDYEKKKKPAVWMINPVALNNISLKINPNLNEDKLKEYQDIYPNTWTKGSPALENIRLAFKHSSGSFLGYNPTEFPLAIQLTYCHSRMSAQKGCFTIHGLDERDFEKLFDINSCLVKKGYFKKYIFDENQREDIYKELQKLGITYGSVYPDLIGLSKELEDRFFYQKDKPVYNDSKIDAIEIKTETLESDTYQNLNKSYQNFINKKVKEVDFYSFDKTSFWKEDNRYIYFISYLVKVKQ